MTAVAVPAERFPRWIANFEARHGSTTLTVADGRLAGAAVDGSNFVAALPFSRSYEGVPETDPFLAAAHPPADWAVLLVRKGGFAVARLSGGSTTASKVGQRHVQGRTKAGGQSQQRFARRRDNQARAAFEAAAEHAVRLIAGAPAVVVGGDTSAVAAVLEDPRLKELSVRVVGRFLTVPDPRRGVLEEAVEAALALTVEVENA
ncbi:peptide subunit release factor 1 (eRF1) [Marmoricola sp. OAE513]|uniref:acVLRF1 family peptidyl-tRNA hydrolase n=1 Tax=Marmoricola sp. OAE513 TaxID=2817894 RepID=UPI001AE48C48